MALMRIIINHGAMPDGINGLAQVNEAAELYRGPKTFPAQSFFPAASQSAFFDVALSVSCKVMDGLSKAVPVDFFEHIHLHTTIGQGVHGAWAQTLQSIAPKSRDPPGRHGP